MPISQLIKKRINLLSFKSKKFFETLNPISLYNKADGIYYNGVYSLKRSSQLYMNDIVMENCYDFDDYKSNLDFLDSSKGKMIQREYFYRNIYSPIRRWCKNRKIRNSDLFVALVRIKLYDPNNIDTILSTLDEVVKSNYNFDYNDKALIVAKYKMSIK